MQDSFFVFIFKFVLYKWRISVFLTIFLIIAVERLKLRATVLGDAFWFVIRHRYIAFQIRWVSTFYIFSSIFGQHMDKFDPCSIEYWNHPSMILHYCSNLVKNAAILFQSHIFRLEPTFFLVIISESFSLVVQFAIYFFFALVAMQPL